MTQESEYTLEELLICRMALEFEPGNLCVGATILSDLAARLAKRLYHPDIMLCAASRAAVDCDVNRKSLFDEWEMSATARMSLDWPQLFQIIAHGKLQIWIGPVQIDQFGNSNISVAGPWDRPKAQFVGARGIPDDLWGCKKLCYHVRQHNPRSFVSKVDFVCGAGNDGESNSRRARPGVVISDLGVFDFETPTGEMQVVSLHPGVTLAHVKSMTPFPILAPASVAVTRPPGSAELAIIRGELDPLELRRLESSGVAIEMMAQLAGEDVRLHESVNAEQL